MNNDAPLLVLNRQVMLDIIGDDPKSIRRFELNFLKQAQSSYVKLVTLFKSNQIELIKEEAHFLKTSAKAIGAEKVSALLQELEYASLDSNNNRCRNLIELTAGALKDVNKEIANVR